MMAEAVGTVSAASGTAGAPNRRRLRPQTVWRPRFGRVWRPAAKYAPDSAASRRRRRRTHAVGLRLHQPSILLRGCASRPPRPRVEICRRRRTAARRRPQAADPICGPHVRALRPRRRCPPPLARGCACFGRAQGGSRPSACPTRTFAPRFRRPHAPTTPRAGAVTRVDGRLGPPIELWAAVCAAVRGHGGRVAALTVAEL